MKCFGESSYALGYLSPVGFEEEIKSAQSMYQFWFQRVWLKGALRTMKLEERMWP